MEQKNRITLVIAITVVIVIAMFTSFGRSLFTTSIPQVVLPSPGSSQNTGEGDSLDSTLPNQLQRVEVTTETVQNVIASLSRSASYYRECSIESFWGEASSTLTTVRTWVDGPWSHSSQTTPSGLIRHDLIGGGMVYYWYEGESSWLEAPADDSSADLAQHLPTYETVLRLPTQSITAAGYEKMGDLPCIYVEVTSPVAGYLERYWVSVDSGLLVAAETWHEGSLVYRMSALAPTQSLLTAPKDIFALPNGTVLHQLPQ